MKKKNIAAIILFLLLIITALGVYLRVSHNDSAKSKRPARVTNVTLGKLNHGSIMLTETLTGNILPVQQANIYSRVNGNIERIYVDIGSYVGKGTLLALIDTSIYTQNKKQAYAALLQARANLENTKLNYERNKSLNEQDLNAKQDVDNSKTAYDVANAQVQAALANYNNSATQLGYCRITAPFSGYITKRLLDAGAYVTSSPNSPGSTLFTLMDINRLKVSVYLPEKDIPLLDSVQDIQITADALPGKVFSGRVSKTGESVDLNTRTMEIEIEIENPKKILKPGMYATITIILDKKDNADILPNYVVLNDQDGDYVYVVGPDDIAAKKYVKTGISHNNNYEILSGLDDNDRIVFDGQTLIKNGSKVNIVTK